MGLGSPTVRIKILLLELLVVAMGSSEAATWCTARSDASATALQTALDYACGTGRADCAPIQPNGLCYLPNTAVSHASYAFNSYYQRSNQATGSCDFGGTATTTVTDPSYGSCTYPSSSGNAGGSTPTAPNPPGVISSPPPPLSPGGGFSPGSPGSGGAFTPPSFGPPLPNVVDASNTLSVSLEFILFSVSLCLLRLLF